MTEKVLAILQDWSVPPEGQVGKLPRIVCPDCSKSSDKVCSKHRKKQCTDCGNWITERHIHLDYFGHAETTRALILIDSNWEWAPVAFADDGGPLVRVVGGTAELWIKLTLLGITRIGVGTCQANKPEMSKELIGDALRNAAMRFGVALSLWSKEEWTTPDAEDDPPAGETWELKIVKHSVVLEIERELSLPEPRAKELARQAWETLGDEDRESWPITEAQELIAACVAEAAALDGMDTAVGGDET